MKRQWLLLCVVVLILPLFQECLYADGSDAKKGKPWQGEISAGYDRSAGNTETSQLTAGLYANRRTEDNEFTLKGNGFYSSSEKKMNAQKWYAMGRYAFSFWERKWYNFYKLESDHDRFANIDYRLIPSTGLGYWFSDEPHWKMVAELAIGWEHTDFRDNTEDSDEAVLIPRGFLEKTIFGKTRISENILVYPSLTDTGQYRFHSETSLTSPINDKLSLRLSFIDDYNSDAPGDTKKNDYWLVTSLVYSF